MAKFTGYLNVFEDKLHKIHKNIKKLEDEENTKHLERLRKEAKNIEDIIDDMKEHDMVQATCPCCGEKFRINTEKVKLKR